MRTSFKDPMYKLLARERNLRIRRALIGIALRAVRSAMRAELLRREKEDFR